MNPNDLTILARAASILLAVLVLVYVLIIDIPEAL